MYGELGYSVLYYVGTEMALVPFMRVDYYDTTFQESDPDFDLPAFVVVGFAVAVTSAPASRPIVGDPHVG